MSLRIWIERWHTVLMGRGRVRNWWPLGAVTGIAAVIAWLLYLGQRSPRHNDLATYGAPVFPVAEVLGNAERSDADQGWSRGAASCQTVAGGESPQSSGSRLSRDTERPSGRSWWGEQPTWLRHLVYWAFALCLLFVPLFDGEPAYGPSESWWVYVAFGVVFLVEAGVAVGLVYREAGQVSAGRTLSRSLIVTTVILATVAALLYFSGVDIEVCRTVAGVETCRGQASPRQMLLMLAWHAANVVPALSITDTLEWSRPARSAHPVVAASILTVRLSVVIGILAVLKRLWDKWSAGPGPKQPPSR